jgi:hypothetical protein
MTSRLRPSPAFVVALIALFVSIGGVGYAASKIGTDDIKSQAVTKPKLAKKAVSSGKLDGQAVTTGKIAADAVRSGKINDGAVKTNNLADDGVTGDKVLNDTLTGDNIDESTLGTVPSATNAQQLGGLAASSYSQRIFARVQYNDANPTILASSPGISTNGEGALGFPRVLFPQSMNDCAVLGSASSNAGTQIVRRSTAVTGTQVQFAVRDENGAPVRSNFDLIAVC